MATTIKIKHSTTAGNAPSSLAQGELAINVADGNLFYGDGSGVSQDFAVNTITAQQYIVSSSVTYMTQSFSSGSTAFGDSTDDTHIFTGSVNITGSVTATSFTGDGTGLSGVGTVDTTGTPASNQLAIFSDANTIQGISDLSITNPAPNVYLLNIDTQTTNFTGQLDIDDAVNNGAVVDINNTYTSLMTTTHYALKVAGGDAFGTPGSGIAFGGHFLAGNTNANNPDSIALYAQGHEDGAPNSYAAIFSGSAGGVVGINTMEPTVELDVVGSISASSNVVASAFYGDGSNLSGVSTATGVEDNADVTDATNVTAAGALMDSELTDLAAVKAIDQGLTTTSDVTFNHITASGDISASGTIKANKIESAQLVSHLDDPNTGLQFGSDTVVIEGNNAVIAKFASTFIELNKETKLTLEKSSNTDGDANGDIVYFGGEAESIAEGQIVYYNSSGNWALADADSEATAKGLLGVALGSDASSDGVLLKGMVTLDHDPGTVGDPLYLSDGTAGQATSTAPNSTNDIVRLIGYCLDSNNGQIYFNPSNDFIKHS